MGFIPVRSDRRPLHRLGKGGAEAKAHHGRPRPAEQEGQGEARCQEGEAPNNAIIT